jgi:hypothetical protein
VLELHVESHPELLETEPELPEVDPELRRDGLRLIARERTPVCLFDRRHVHLLTAVRRGSPIPPHRAASWKA